MGEDRRPRTAAIMQPTYLPYLGYFELIARADVFVLLDDVQFERSSWQSRNRIRTAQGELVLTVPTRRGPLETRIDEVEIAEERGWRQKHLTSIRQAYAGRPGLVEALALLEGPLGPDGPTRLAALNGGLIREAAKRAGLTTEILNASDLGCGGRRSEHVLALCRAVGAELYLSPMGAQDYLEADGVLEAAGLPVRLQPFTNLAYPQGREPFTPYMSFVDALANLGWTGLGDLIRAMASSDPPKRASVSR